MTIQSEIRRAICCPSGQCCYPRDCYAERRDRSYPVQIHEAAQAVAKLLCEKWRAANGGQSTSEAARAGGQGDHPGDSTPGGEA